MGLVCEPVTGGDPACFSPVVVRGSVFDLADGTPIPGARVVALDENRAPASGVAVTDVNGNYELWIPSERDAEGNPIGIDLTLRSDADGYQTFPSGVRVALPVATSIATQDDNGVWVVQSALTDIGMIALPGGGGLGSIAGDAELNPDIGGVLVVAEGPGGGLTALADLDGDYAILNVPAGTYDVTAYSRGVVYETVTVDVVDGAESVADLGLTGDGTATLDGSIQIVNPEQGEATSVILVVESTFDDILVRGANPPGLRAPEPGIAPDVTGAFSIDGVPPGNYVILAAFENDYLVRDPDTCIAGTEIVHMSFTAGETVTVEEGFKVTGGLTILGPGAGGPEEVTGTPVFSWVDDSSEDQYDVVVFDSFGDIVWETSIPGVSGGDVELSYGGPALESGMFYQFRVVSSRTTGGGETCEISQSEDLEGVFYVP